MSCPQCGESGELFIHDLVVRDTLRTEEDSVVAYITVIDFCDACGYESEPREHTEILPIVDPKLMERLSIIHKDELDNEVKV